MLKIVKTGLTSRHNVQLVDELLAAYQESKRNYYLGGLRLSAVEGGRFCEAAFRLLEERTTGRFTPLSKQINTDKIIFDLTNIASTAQPDSIRLHIPRALRVVYDIRNKRDAAHLADGIDPNLQDATLVISVLDWVLAELVRMYHSIPPNEAKKIVDGIVIKRVPAIQDFNGFLKVLNPKLSASDHNLLILYQRGNSGADYEDLLKWARPPMRHNLKKTLKRLTHDRAFIHNQGNCYFITEAGIRYVEEKKLLSA